MIAVCCYVLYRMISPPKRIDTDKNDTKVIDIDYEEIDNRQK